MTEKETEYGAQQRGPLSSRREGGEDTEQELPVARRDGSPPSDFSQIHFILLFEEFPRILFTGLTPGAWEYIIVFVLVLKGTETVTAS